MADTLRETLGRGPAADPTGAVAAAALAAYSPPPAVLKADPGDLDVTVKVAANYADAGREYPVHTPAAAWVSAAVYHRTGSDAAGPAGRIKEALARHRLAGEWARLEREARPRAEKKAAARTALPGRYPLDTAEEFGAALDYYGRYAGRLGAADRRAFAGQLVKAAADFPGACPADRLAALELDAGLGRPAAGWRAEFEVRAKLARQEKTPYGDTLARALEAAAEKVAAELSSGSVMSGQFTTARELADLLWQVDRKMGWGLADPAAGLVSTTPAKAAAALADGVKAASGRWWKAADLDRLPDAEAHALLACGPLPGRPAKAAALADPARCATAERLLRSYGAEPVGQPPRPRVDWAALAAG